MQYQGPSKDDLRNVIALNRHFLRVLLSCREFSPEAAHVRRLSQVERGRLAETPFLLFSLREKDHGLWHDMFVKEPQLDLGPATEVPDDALQELKAASLSFLWQLSARNAYAARVVSGAPLEFCERLANVTLIDLLQRTANQPNLLVPRYGAEHDVWRRLTDSGVSATARLQSMTQQYALQHLLTGSVLPEYARLPAAASRFAARPRSRRTTTAPDP